MTILRLILVAIALVLWTSAADARPHHKRHHRHHRTHVVKPAPVTPWAAYWARQLRHNQTAFRPAKHRRAWVGGRGRRPRAWCGWYMRGHVASDPGPAFNRAREWARWGRPASPGPGVIVVWRHHVGKIVGKCDGKICPVHSGNDGHRVRTRMRSVAGAIAFRVAG